MKQFKGILLAMISSATFGMIPLFALPVIRGGMGVDSVMFYRFALSSAVVGAYLLLRRADLRVTLREFGVLFGLGALYAFTSLLLTIAYLYIPSGVATTIHFLYPLLVAAIMALFFKDRISVSVMVAALAAVAGVWLLSGGTDAAVGMKGLTLALATVATYAVYIVGVNKSCVQHMKGLKMVFFILLSATIIFAGNLFVKGEIPESIPDWSAAVHLILLALIPTLVSDLTLVLAVQRIGSTTTAILGCLEPLTAVALGIFFLGERFVAEQFAGVALIVAAVVTVILGGRPGRFSVRRLIPDFLSNFIKRGDMIKLIRITDGQDSRLEHLVPLYEEAFCSSERRTVGQLRRMIGATPAMHFNMIESDGELCGLFVYWDMGEFYYLEHLAVAPHMRNRKIGQQVLEHVETSLPGIRLLEVEPAEDELTARRVAFYRRNGYRIVDRSYVQPSYENFWRCRSAVDHGKRYARNGCPNL